MNIKNVALLALIVFPVLSYGQALGQRLTGDLEIFSYKSSSVKFRLPLPPGWWEITTLNDFTSGGGVAKRMQRLSLHSVEDNKLKMAMLITAMTDSSSARWLDEPCKGTEAFLHKNDYGTKLWRQRCLIVRPVTFLQGDNELTRASLQRLSGIKFDFNAVSAIYTQYDERGVYVVYVLHFFPSTYGLENPLIGNLNMSPYHPSRVKGSGVNESFVAAVVAYSEQLAAAIDNSVADGGESASRKINLPPFIFDNFANQNKSPIPNSPVLGPAQAVQGEQKSVDITVGRPNSSATISDSGVAKQLRELKELLDSGVLSKTEHDKLRKKILDSL